MHNNFWRCIYIDLYYVLIIITISTTIIAINNNTIIIKTSSWNEKLAEELAIIFDFKVQTLVLLLQ